MATVETLLTAEEYSLLPDNGQLTELIRGRVVSVNVPRPRHGYFLSKIDRIIGNFVDEHGLGRVMAGDAGVVVERGPDTVRGADVCYYSFARLPQGDLPEGYFEVVPELIFEVRSLGDRWSEILVKVGEYLGAGVLVVCVHDIQTRTFTVYRPDQPQQVLREENEFEIPDLLPGFRVPVRRFFE